MVRNQGYFVILVLAKLSFLAVTVELLTLHVDIVAFGTMLLFLHITDWYSSQGNSPLAGRKANNNVGHPVSSFSGFVVVVVVVVVVVNVVVVAYQLMRIKQIVIYHTLQTTRAYVWVKLKKKKKKHQQITKTKQTNKNPASITPYQPPVHIPTG